MPGAAPLPTRRGLLSGILTVGAGTAAERLLGYLRDVGMAAAFGLGASLDAFNVALSIPLLLTALFPGPGGARISSLFIPLYTESRERVGAEDARRLARTVMNLLFMALLLGMAVLLLVPGAVVKVFAPGFSGDVAAQTARVLRLLAPVLVLWGLGGFCRAFLLSHEKFAKPTIAQVASNLFLVLFVFLAATRVGVEGMAVATVVSGMVLLVMQLPAMAGTGFRPGTGIDWQHPGLRRFGRLLVPVVFGMGLGQLNGMVDRIMASTLDEGSVSALTYANRLRSLPMELFIVGVAQPTFPRMCLEYTRGGMKALHDISLFTFRVTSSVTLPSVAFVLALAGPIASISFGYGAVGQEGARLIAGALSFYIIGLVPMALGTPLAGVFYASQDTRTPTLISAASLGTNIVFNLIFIRILGLNGLPLATTIAALVYTVITFVVLKRRWAEIPGREIADTLARTLGASLIMGAGCWAVFHFSLQWLPVGGRAGLALSLLAAMVLGVLLYLAAASALRVRGIGLAVQILRERLGRPR